MDKNQKIETILDECLGLLLTGETTVDQCLERYPEYAAELKPLLITAVSIEKALDVKPSPEFKARARYQLQLKMAGPAPKRASIWSLQPKWVVATMAVMVVFLMSGGTVLAANSSMPGSPLYSIKIASENISLQLAGSDIKKAEIYAAIAERRVDEMVYVVENGKTAYAENIAIKYDDTLIAMNALPLASEVEFTMAASTSDTFGASASTENPTQKATSPQFAIASTPTTTGSESNQTSDRSSASTTTVPVVASVPVPDITLNVPTTSNNKSHNASDIAKDKLKQYIAYNAIHHPEKLQELLNKSPESLKPLLRRMIENASQDNLEFLGKLDN
jgi:hypothetical protein